MADKPLDQKLFEEPYRFEFFQAVRLVQKMFPERRSVGRDALPADEVVRFRTRIALDFPSSEVHEVREVEPDGNAERKLIEVFVNFMGLVGPSGVLPVHYTELVLDRIRHRDTALWAFLDIFNHRAISMFYRAWAKYRFPVGYESGDDDFTGYLFDLAGIGTRGLRGRLDLPDEAMLPYTGLIAQRPHSANALANILSDYFSTNAKIEQLFGQWLDLESDDFSRLGKKNSSVGINAIIGTRVWNQQSKFRVKMGPLSFKQFQDFLPNGPAHRPLGSIIRFMVGPELDFDVQLLLKARQVPGTVLTTRALRRPMLGWTSYLKTLPFETSDEQVVIEIDV